MMRDERIGEEGECTKEERRKDEDDEGEAG